MWETEFIVNLDHFLPFCPFNNLKNKILKKRRKKTPGDIIILHKCSINGNCMMYSSWDMKCDRQNFLSFWTVFCTFTSLTTWKIKILKNWKTKLGDIIILHKCTKNLDHMLYCSLDRCVMDVIIFHFGLFFDLYLPNNPKIKIKKKMKKTPGDIIIYNSVPKIMIKCYTVPEIWHVMDVIIFHFGPFFCSVTCLTAQEI